MQAQSIRTQAGSKALSGMVACALVFVLQLSFSALTRMHSILLPRPAAAVHHAVRDSG
jgi:hypothetical protein